MAYPVTWLLRVGLLIKKIGAIDAKSFFKLNVDLGPLRQFLSSRDKRTNNSKIIKQYHLAIQQLKVIAITTHTLQTISQLIALIDGPSKYYSDSN